jgi:hypothetical protein
MIEFDQELSDLLAGVLRDPRTKSKLPRSLLVLKRRVETIDPDPRYL